MLDFVQATTSYVPNEEGYIVVTPGAGIGIGIAIAIEIARR